MTNSFNLFQYAFFAYKTGNFGPAFDILTDSRRVNRPSKFTTNLKLLILTDVGRLNDALLVIRSELLPSRDAIRLSSNTENESNEEVCSGDTIIRIFLLHQQ